MQINGKPGFIQYVSPTQINVLAPADTSTGTVTVTVTVTNAAGTSNSSTTTLQPVLPGLSVLSSYVRAVRYPDGAIGNGTAAAETGYTTSAAVGQGDIIALYGTGFGPTSSPAATGALFTGAYPTTNPVTVTIGGVPAEVLFAGLAGPGLYQINVRVPASLSDGDKALVATVLGVSSQSTALLKVAASAKLAGPSITRTVFARVRGLSDTRRGRPSSPPYANPNLEQLMWLGGLNGPAQHSDGGSPLVRASLVAAEENGGLVQIS